MLSSYLLPTLALPLIQAARLILTNDNGWDDPNIRSLFNVLDATTSHELMLCAPHLGNTRPLGRVDGVLNDREPLDEDLFSFDDEFSSSDDDGSLSGDDRSIFDDDDNGLPNHAWNPADNKARVDLHRTRWRHGFNVSDFRLSYTEGTTLYTLSECLADLPQLLYRPRKNNPPKDGHLYQAFWPDIFLFGPQVGSLLGFDRFSHTVSGYQGAYDTAREVAVRGDPAIYFAGANVGTDGPREISSKMYAQLANIVIQAVIESGAPYLPKYTLLHVNFPHVTFERCNNVSQFKFILTSKVQNHSYWLNQLWCKRRGFPFERDVVNRIDGCYVAVSPEYIGETWHPQSRVGVFAHRKLIQKLKPILSCLPNV